MIRKSWVAIVAAFSILFALVGLSSPASAVDAVTVTKANAVTMTALVTVPDSTETITVTIGDGPGLWDGYQAVFPPGSTRTAYVGLRQQDDAWQATDSTGVIATGDVNWLNVLFVMGATFDDSASTVSVVVQDGLVYQLSVDGTTPVPLAPGTTAVPCGVPLTVTVAEREGAYAYPQGYAKTHTVPCAPQVQAVTPLGVMFYTAAGKRYVTPVVQTGVVYTLKAGQQLPKLLASATAVPCGKRLVVTASAAEGFLLTAPYRVVRKFPC